MLEGKQVQTQAMLKLFNILYDYVELALKV
jgi:hypothetical protein